MTRAFSESFAPEKSQMPNNFVNLKPRRMPHHTDITLPIKYRSYQMKCDYVISHVTTPKNAFELIAKTGIYQFENNYVVGKKLV